MNDVDDLKRYVARLDHEAFRNLVERHSGMVYGVALRRTAHPHLAEEAAQTVFIQLAKKAASIRKPEYLATWLHRSVVLESAHLMRKRQRDFEKLERYSEVMVTEPEHEGWRDVVPHLDQALNQLSQADRQLVLDRFYQEHTYAEIAVRTDKTEVACRKQVSRALDKLSRLLRRQGVTISGVVLAQCLQPELAVASPIGFVEVIEGRVADLSGQAATSAVSSTLLALCSSKALLVSLAALSAVAPVIWKKPLAESVTSSADARSYSVLGVRQARLITDQNASIDAFLAAHGTEQLALLMRWLPTADSPGLGELAHVQVERTQSSGLASNTAYFWMLLMQRWLTLDSDRALSFAESTRKNDTRDVFRDLFDVDSMFWAWAKVSPEAALDAAQKHSAKLVVSVLNQWVERDPMKVVELSHGLDPGISVLLDWGDIFKGLAERDLASATKAAMAMEESPSKRSALFAVAMATVANDPEAAMAMVEGRAQVPLHEKWLQSDPESAIRAIQELPKTLEKLTLTRSAGASLASRDYDEARTWALAQRDPQERRAALAGVAVEMAKQEPLRAKEILDALGWDLRDPDVVRTFTARGSSEVRGAVATLESAAERVILEIGKTDRQAALALCEKVSGYRVASDTLDKVASAWLADDRAGFVQAMQGQRPGDVREGMVRLYAEMLVGEGPEEALQWATTQDESLRAAASVEVLKKWIGRDPLAAADAFLTAPFLDTKIKDDSFFIESLSMSSVQDLPGKLHAWLAEQPDREELPRAHEALGRVMAKEDLSEAAEWLNQLEDPNVRQSAIGGVVSTLIHDEHSDREETLAWINQMEPSSAQRRWLKALGKRWMKEDPVAGGEAVAALPLSERDLSRLVQQH